VDQQAPRQMLRACLGVFQVIEMDCWMVGVAGMCLCNSLPKIKMKKMAQAALKPY